ncbi:MAG: hypothetical protein AB4426_34580 [Xenococcaceae cyanobacterium]
MVYASDKNSNSRLEKQLNDFVKSLGEVLVDITALEVNTMVVEHITGNNFIAWEVYRDVYPISREYLAQLGIHESLRDRYLNLRRNLELEYALLLTDPSSEFYAPTVMAGGREDFPILTNPTVDLDEIQTRLPAPIQPTNPEEILKAQRLVKDSRFLRSLRKIGELKAALDNRNRLVLKKEQEKLDNVQSEVLEKTVNTDIIYAQTVIQLDGNIINRYSQEIFDHPQKDLILQIHKEGVEAGEKQWRVILGFVVDMVKRLIN